MLIDMQVAGLAIDPMTEMPILILKDLKGENPLPIWIGLVEAGAIATEIEKIQLARPMTHDLIRNMLGLLGVEILHAEITDLRESTYFATLVLKQGAKVIEVDARPSDAIAVALRAGCPIRVEESVLAKARDIDLRGKQVADAEGGSDILASLSDEEFGKWKM
jgi:bifunctional DNase/RNase